MNPAGPYPGYHLSGRRKEYEDAVRQQGHPPRCFRRRCLSSSWRGKRTPQSASADSSPSQGSLLMNDERLTMNESPNYGLWTAFSFVQEIDWEIIAVKKLENERVRYMTYAMKMQEERKEGREEMQREMAIEMLRDKKPIQEIMRYTKLTEAKIQQIAQENKLL